MPDESSESTYINHEGKVETDAGTTDRGSWLNFKSAGPLFNFGGYFSLAGTRTVILLCARNPDCLSDTGLISGNYSGHL